MTGEKLKLLVIGKSRQPRCFNGLDSAKLPVDYKFNRKAWMNSGIFVFVDNAPSHPKIKLDNAKLVFLPPNTTSKIQPMDQGIIQQESLDEQWDFRVCGQCPIPSKDQIGQC